MMRFFLERWVRPVLTAFKPLGDARVSATRGTLGSAFGFGGNSNAGGAGAKSIHRAIDASLERLGNDFVDLYWMHIWDGVTPAWFAMKAATIAGERRIPGPIAMQREYSLIVRDVEGEHLPAAQEAGMGVMPWSHDRTHDLRRP